MVSTDFASPNQETPATPHIFLPVFLQIWQIQIRVNPRLSAASSLPSSSLTGRSRQEENSRGLTRLYADQIVLPVFQIKLGGRWALAWSSMNTDSQNTHYRAESQEIEHRHHALFIGSTSRSAA